MNKFNLRDKVKIAGSGFVFEVEGIKIGDFGGKEEAYYQMRTKGSSSYWQPESVLSAYVEPKPEPIFSNGDKVLLKGSDEVFKIVGGYISVDEKAFYGVAGNRKYRFAVPEEDITPYVEPKPVPKFKVGDLVRMYGNSFLGRVNRVEYTPNGYLYGGEILLDQQVVNYFASVNEPSLMPYVEPKFKIGDRVNHINIKHIGFYTVKEIYARGNVWRYHLESQGEVWRTNADEDQIVPYIEPKFNVGDPVYHASRDHTTKVLDVVWENGRNVYWIGGFMLSCKVAEHELELIPKAKFKLGDSVYWDHDKSTSKVTMVQWNQLENRYCYQIGGGHSLHAEDHLEARPDPKPAPKFKVGDAVKRKGDDRIFNVEVVLWNQFRREYDYNIDKKIDLVAEDQLESVGAKAAREGFELAQKVAPFLKIDWTLALGYRISAKPQEENQ